MKLTGITFRGKVEGLTPAQAVDFCADKAARSYDDTLDRMRSRTEALQGMLGRLVGVLIDNGQLRAGQVEAIFDYDVTAED